MLRWLTLIAILLTTTSCVEELALGEFATPRYVTNMRGDVPLRAVPPISDRNGNVYVLYGHINFRDTQAYAGKRVSGWKKGCPGHRGDFFGLHGWIGRAQDRAWYWSGEALVEIAANEDTCRLLDRDYRNNALLHMDAVFPVVREAPSRTTTVALIRAEPDPHPFFVVIDLFRNTYFNAVPFEPLAARKIEVLGTGGARKHGRAYLVVKYELDDRTVVEGRTYDLEGNETSRVRIPGMDELTAYSILGNLVSTDGRQISGLLPDGRRVFFTDEEGTVLPASEEMDSVGLHLWQDKTFLVGTVDEKPVVAQVEGDSIGPVSPWEASLRARDSLRGKHVRIVDERQAPMTETTWTNPSSAIGSYPFLSPYTPNQYTDHSAGWLIAGPRYETSGAQITAVAFTPMGISYP